MAVGELLFKFAGETVDVACISILRSQIESPQIIWGRRQLGSEIARKERESLPLLHPVEALKGWDGDKDGDSLLAVANFNLQLIKVSMRAP